MTKKQKLKQETKVLNFFQNADFYYEKAQNKFENKDYLEALFLLTKVQELNKNNRNESYVKAKLLCGEIYYQMGCYEFSNAEFFKILALGQDNLTESLAHQISGNFAKLKETMLALAFFDIFMKNFDPEKMEYFQIKEAMNAIEKMQQTLEQNVIDTENKDIDVIYKELLKTKKTPIPKYKFRKKSIDDAAKTFIFKANHLIRTRQIEKAMLLIDKIARLNSSNIEILEQIAMLYYQVDQPLSAKTICETVFEREEKNVSASLIFALCSIKEGDFETAKFFLDTSILNGSQEQNIQNLYYTGMCFFEIEELEIAKKYFQQLAQKEPYNVKYLHLMAVVSFTQGDFEKARTFWQTILRIKPNSCIAKFYIELVVKQVKNKEKLKKVLKFSLPTTFDIPKEQANKKLFKIKQAYKNIIEIGKLPNEKAKQELIADIFWLLESEECCSQNFNKAKKEAMLLFSKMDLEYAQFSLRCFLLKQKENIALKNHAIQILSQTKAKEPFYTIARENFAAMVVSPAVTREDIPPSYNEVAKRFTSALLMGLTNYLDTFEANKKCMNEAHETWKEFIDQQNGVYINILNPQTFAAAVEYLTKKRLKISVSQKEIYSAYEVSGADFKKVLDVFEKITKNKYKREKN